MKIGFGLYQPAKFALPENPITRAIATHTASVGAGCSGLGCPSGLGDMNALSSNIASLNFGAVLTGDDFISGIPNVAVLLIGYLALSMFGRGSDYKRASEQLREKHPRGYKRAARRVKKIAEAVAA